MTCSRCLGLMVEDQFLDMEGAIWRDVDDQLALCELRSCPRLRDRAASPGPTGEGLGAPKW